LASASDLGRREAFSPEPGGQNEQRFYWEAEFMLPRRWFRLVLQALPVALLLCFGGCGAGGRSETTDKPPAQSQEDVAAFEGVEPGARGGVLVIGSLADPKTFNPVVSNETSSSDIWHLMFDRLVGFDPVDLTFKPHLAKSWQVSEDGRTWTFHLRSGLTWSDGTELTSEDVVFAFDIIYDDQISSMGREILSLEGQRFDVSAPDQNTVVIQTHKPYGPMLYALASSLWPLPRHALESAYQGGTFEESFGVDTVADRLAVSGPFRLERVEPGRTVLARNPYYWKVDEAGTRLPYLDRIMFVNIGDWNAWRLRFEAGEVDYYQCRPEEVWEFRDGRARGDCVTYDLGLETGTTHLWFNIHPGSSSDGSPYVEPFKRKWFEDRRFRQATSHAIDRESIVNAVYHGWGQAIYGPTSPVDELWYNPEIPKYSYDPGRAASLLDEMGLVDRDGDGIREDTLGRDVRFTLVTNVETPSRTAMGNLIVMDLRKVGVDAVFNSLDFNTLITTLCASYKYDACLLSITAGPDPAGGLDVWLSGGGMHAFYPNQESPATKWEAEVDRLVFLNLTGRNYDERKTHWDRAQEILAGNLGWIYIANRKTFIAVSNRFGNVRPQPYQEWHRAAWNAEELFVKVDA
jgi:peptide/nickel transport system substrate-binding protein